MNESAGLTQEEKTWGMICHLSTFCTFMGVPFGGIIAPLIIWQIKKKESDFISYNGKAALNFQITMAIAFIISAILTMVFIGILLIFIVLIVDIVFTVKAAISANNGEYFQYPMTINFIK